MSDTIGTRIGQLRGKETQQQLADALGVSRSLVKAWETNERPVRSDDLVKLSSHFGVSCDYLLCLVDKDNSTKDEKLRMISEYTGLSNSAINALHGLLTPDSNGVYAAGFTDNDFYRPSKLLSEFFNYGNDYFFYALVDLSDAINMLQRIDKEPSPSVVNKATKQLEELGISAVASYELATLKADAASSRFSYILQEIYHPLFFESWSRRKAALLQSDNENQSNEVI